MFRSAHTRSKSSGKPPQYSQEKEKSSRSKEKIKLPEKKISQHPPQNEQKLSILEGKKQVKVPQKLKETPPLNKIEKITIHQRSISEENPVVVTKTRRYSDPYGRKYIEAVHFTKPETVLTKEKKATILSQVEEKNNRYKQQKEARTKDSIKVLIKKDLPLYAAAIALYSELLHFLNNTPPQKIADLGGFDAWQKISENSNVIVWAANVGLSASRVFGFCIYLITEKTNVKPFREFWRDYIGVIEKIKPDCENLENELEKVYGFLEKSDIALSPAPYKFDRKLSELEQNLQEIIQLCQNDLLLSQTRERSEGILKTLASLPSLEDSTELNLLLEEFPVTPETERRISKVKELIEQYNRKIYEIASKNNS